MRRIFELAASGVGQGRIARLLNEDGVASPRAQRGRPQGWAVSSVHEVLFRPLYRGELVWNSIHQGTPDADLLSGRGLKPVAKSALHTSSARRIAASRSATISARMMSSP